MSYETTQFAKLSNVLNGVLFMTGIVLLWPSFSEFDTDKYP